MFLVSFIVLLGVKCETTLDHGIKHMIERKYLKINFFFAFLPFSACFFKYYLRPFFAYIFLEFGICKRKKITKM